MYLSISTTSFAPFANRIYATSEYIYDGGVFKYGDGVYSSAVAVRLATRAQAQSPTERKMKEVLSTIEKPDEILNMVSSPDGDGARVVIGSESTVRVMDHSALVYIPIVKDGRNLGTIGVLGPARMDYAKVLATLEKISGNITSLLDEEKRLTDGSQ